MDRKELFNQINSLEKRKERAELELKRHMDYQESLSNYIEELSLKIIAARKQISKTASPYKGEYRYS